MLRGFIWDRLRRASSPALRRWVKSRSWFLPLSTRLFGNAVYSRSYYRDIERLEGASSEHIAQWIADHLAPRTAIDLGCGSGVLMSALARRGVTVCGVDLSPVAIAMARDRGLDATVVDLTSTAPGDLPGTPRDLVISCEVAEHLEPPFAERFVEHLASAGEHIYLTAAEPDPDSGPGLYHFNEQPNAYWIERITARGFTFDASMTDDARARFGACEVIEYLAKPMVFHRLPE